MDYFLHWYRDLGRGQEAAEALGAVQVTFGVWPIAHLNIPKGDPENVWKRLYSEFGINAMYCDYSNSHTKGGVSRA